MSDLPRFTDGAPDDPTGALFRSMRADGPAPGRKNEVLAAALAAAATVTVAATASATAGVVATAASGPVASALSGAAPAALPIAAATATPATAAIVPGVSIVKMFGAFVLGGAVTAAGLVAGTQLLDPPSRSAVSTVPTGLATDPAPSAKTTSVVVVPSPTVPEKDKQLDENAPPVETSGRLVAPTAPLFAPSARVERNDQEAPNDPTPPPPPPVASAALPPEPTLADEVSSLDAARRALSSGDGPGAVRALDAFQGKFPRARLGTEALVLRIEALVASGRLGEARGLGEPFLAAHPDSPFAPRVRRAIGRKENVLTIP